MDVEFKTPPTKEELKEAFNYLRSTNKEAHGRMRLKVTFNSPQRILLSSRKSVTVTEKEMYFFFNDPNAAYATRTNYRRGYIMDYSFIRNIKNIEIVKKHKMTEEERAKKVKQFLNHFHQNMWTEIQDKLTEDPQRFETDYYDNFEVVYLSRWFSEFTRLEIAEAMGEKRNFTVYGNAEKRDVSLELKLGDDGLYRGWVSSEYPGCGNGQYFIVVSPHHAVFGEYD